MKEPSRFLPFLPNFSPFFPDFSLFFPIFGKFFAVRGGALPPCPQSCHHPTNLKSKCPHISPANMHLVPQYSYGLLFSYTAIFLINGLCIVYCSLLQCLTLVYLGWGQNSEFFCFLVTTCRLWSGTVVGYRSTTAAYC